MDSLEVGLGVFEAVRGGVEKGLFVGGGAPLTFAAAAAEVAKRDEERKAWEEARREARSKGRSVKGGAVLPRGVNKGGVIGGSRDDLSPWWLVMEVGGWVDSNNKNNPCLCWNSGRWRRRRRRCLGFWVWVWDVCLVVLGLWG